MKRPALQSRRACSELKEMLMRSSLAALQSGAIESPRSSAERKASMKVSILIAITRAAPCLTRTLDSVRSQLHDDWEIVVVSDRAHERIASEVRAFSHHVSQPVRLECLGHHGGTAAVRNRLLELARGNAVAFLDPCDYWDPIHLSLSVRLIELGYDMIVAGARTFDPSTDTTLRHHTAPETLPHASIATLFAQDGITACSTVTMRTTLARAVGGFDVELDFGEDRDFWFRSALRGARFAHGQMTCHCAKRVVSKRDLAEGAVRFYEKHADLPVIPVGKRRRALAHSLLTLGRLARVANARRSAACLWHAWHLRLWHWQAPLHLVWTYLCALRTAPRVPDATL